MKYGFIFIILVGILFAQSEALAASSAVEVLKLKVGFVKKLTCEGRLFVSAVGNDRLVHLEALPKELGCAVILKPIGGVGETNLILETSTGTVKIDLAVYK